MENKEQVFVGKHYRMKQAFSQEELHRREAVCTREEPPACTAALSASSGYALGVRVRPEGRISESCRYNPLRHTFPPCPGGKLRGNLAARPAHSLSWATGIRLRAVEKACALLRRRGCGKPVFDSQKE